MVNTPQIASVETAVRLYYEKPFLFNTDIHELFPSISPATVVRLKKRVRECNKNTVEYNSKSVRTTVAYETWGLDIEDLEKRLMKLKKIRGEK